MFISEKEVKRIVSIHFKEKYEMDVNTNDIEWVALEDSLGELPCYLDGMNIGGVVDEEDNSNSD